MPLASNPITGVFNSTSNSNIDSTQYLAKIDQTVSAGNHLSGRYFYNQDNFQRPFNAPTRISTRQTGSVINRPLSLTRRYSAPSFTTDLCSQRRPLCPDADPRCSRPAIVQDLGQNMPSWQSPGKVIFPGIRANISGFVDMFSGGALTQDSTSFDYKGSAVKATAGAHHQFRRRI